MSPIDIVRAWKDPEYRSSLSEKDRSLIPDHPSGVVELSDSQLDGIAGGLAVVADAVVADAELAACSCSCCRCTC